MTPDLPPRPIDLAQEPAFMLGALEVRPATLEVVAGEARELLEPRIMQVLVALAARRGEVVSRDELNERCWGGRVVGDDALNRCIARIRRLAEAHGGFAVETVPRVGFRLSEAAAGRGRGGALRIGLPIVLLAALAALAAVGGLWIWRSGAFAPPVGDALVAVAPFQVLGEDAATRDFGLRLADQVAGVVDENVVNVTLPTGDAADSDLTVGGSVSRVGDRWRVRAFLVDTGSKTTLWSRQFESADPDDAALGDQVAAAVVSALYAAVEPRAQRGLRLDPQTTALWIAAAEAVQVPRDLKPDEALRMIEQVVRRAPRFAQARATYALALASASRRAPPAERASLEARARREAARAQRMNAATAGPSYAALAVLARSGAPDDFVAREDLTAKGLAASPENPFMNMDVCRLLVSVGRAREGLRHCDRANALRPLAAPLGYSHAHALMVAGETHLADRAAARAYRFYPDHVNSWRTRLETLAFTGAPAQAAALLDAPTAQAWHPDGRAAFRQFLAARTSGTAADAERAMAALWAAARAGRLDPRYVVLAAAAFGRTDEAFAALAEPGFAFNADYGYLFEPVAAPLRRDPRFWQAAARAGFLRYWRARGVWPDFCADPALRIDCKAAAASVAS